MQKEEKCNDEYKNVAIEELNELRKENERLKQEILLLKKENNEMVKLKQELAEKDLLSKKECKFFRNELNQLENEFERVKKSNNNNNDSFVCVLSIFVKWKQFLDEIEKERIKNEVWVSLKWVASACFVWLVFIWFQILILQISSVNGMNYGQMQHLEFQI